MTGYTFHFYSQGHVKRQYGEELSVLQKSITSVGKSQLFFNKYRIGENVTFLFNSGQTGTQEPSPRNNESLYLSLALLLPSASLCFLKYLQAHRFRSDV